jgi:hypothetical protein
VRRAAEKARGNSPPRSFRLPRGTRLYKRLWARSATGIRMRFPLRVKIRRTRFEHNWSATLPEADFTSVFWLSTPSNLLLYPRLAVLVGHRRAALHHLAPDLMHRRTDVAPNGASRGAAARKSLSASVTAFSPGGLPCPSSNHAGLWLHLQELGRVSACPPLTRTSLRDDRRARRRATRLDDMPTALMKIARLSAHSRLSALTCASSPNWRSLISSGLLKF